SANAEKRTSFGMIRITTMLALLIFGGAAIARAQEVRGTFRLGHASWAYRAPSSGSGKIKRVHAGRFVNVIGVRGDFVEVVLHGGETGYVPRSAVQLARGR